MKEINKELIDGLLLTAAESPRLRTHHNLHDSYNDPVQRLLVAAKKGSYFRPHRHVDSQETVLMLRGQMEHLQFDDAGNIIERTLLGPHTGMIGIELPPHHWHGWIVVSEEACFFETKQGPYKPASAKDFAPWAPEEGAAEAITYLEQISTTE